MSLGFMSSYQTRRRSGTYAPKQEPEPYHAFGKQSLLLCTRSKETQLQYSCTRKEREIGKMPKATNESDVYDRQIRLWGVEAQVRNEFENMK
jgi:hypothetical protein